MADSKINSKTNSKTNGIAVSRNKAGNPKKGFLLFIYFSHFILTKFKFHLL